MMGRRDRDQASLFIGRSLTDTRASCGALFPRIAACSRGTPMQHLERMTRNWPAVTQHAAGLFHASFNPAHAFQASQLSLNCTFGLL
jgi:hypothetical protein